MDKNQEEISLDTLSIVDTTTASQLRQRVATIAADENDPKEIADEDKNDPKDHVSSCDFNKSDEVACMEEAAAGRRIGSDPPKSFIQAQLLASSQASCRSSHGGASSAGASATGGLQVTIPTDLTVSRIDDSGGEGPTAYLVTAYLVTIPEGFRGNQFSVTIAGQKLFIGCPRNVRAGTKVRIVPPPPPTDLTEEPTSPIGCRWTPPTYLSPVVFIPPPPPPTAYMVTIPEGVRGNQQFFVMIAGQKLMIRCPRNVRAGTKVRIVPPPPPPTGPPQSSRSGPSKKKKKDEQSQLFEFLVPNGVQAGCPLMFLVGGVHLLITCPPNAGSGQRVRFKIPVTLTRLQPTIEATQIRLSYDKGRWTRTIRVSDMNFQWVRMKDRGDIDTVTLNPFDAEKSAYIRKIAFQPGSVSRFRDGRLSLVPANQGFVDTSIKGNNDEDLVSYGEIAAEAQVKNFEKKAAWFQQKCAHLCDDGHMRMNIQRQNLLEDSVCFVMSLSRKDLRKIWRPEFIGEPGIDGGVAREWFQLVTLAMFDPGMGLWSCSSANQMCMEINPASKFITDNYLVYYRFLGRVIGKALFDRQLVAGHMVQYLYKHIIGWPVTFKDIGSIDEDTIYSNLKQLQSLAKSGEDLEILCLDFTTITQQVMGELELVPAGVEEKVGNDDLPPYLEAMMKYKMMDRVKQQLNELLLGIFDVIPEPLLTVFDFQELEFLMCGLPEIDVVNWKENTHYSGDYEAVGPDYPTCQWFWDIVKEFDQEMKARLLQFVTGTSGVPSRGFAYLQGNDGNIRLFTIHGVPVEFCLYPRAHTALNRIVLPRYETKYELRERLKDAVKASALLFLD